MSKSTRFISLDDSKNTIEVAVADSGREGEVRRFGLIPNTPAAMRKLVCRLGRPKELHFAYEAGPGGYGIHLGFLWDQPSKDGPGDPLPSDPSAHRQEPGLQARG